MPPHLSLDRRSLVLGWSPPESVLKALENLPGLNVTNGTATGPPDAVAAACFRLGIDARPHPAPLHRWGTSTALRGYQRTGVSWLLGRLDLEGSAILADDMGLGKTAQVITALSYLNKARGRVLILCPRAADETWREELNKWGPISHYILKPGMVDVEAAQTADAVICSHDIRSIEKALKLIYAHERPATIVIDEAHRFKGRRSARSRLLMDMMAMARYRILVSATPQPNRPMDWWQQLRLAFGARRFGSQWEFDHVYCGAQPGPHGGLVYPKKTFPRADELALRLSYVMLRREAKDVLGELPPLQIQVRWVDASQEGRSAFTRCQAGLDRATMSAAVLATLPGKVDEALALAVEAKRFLLCTWTRAGAQELHRLLNEEHDTPCVLVMGGMSTKVRMALIKSAIANGWGVVATTDAVSESLNLQEVGHIGILHALDWTPSKLMQLFRRLYRPAAGVKQAVTWYVLAMKESADQVILETNIDKLNQWASVMGKESYRAEKHALSGGLTPEEVKAEEDAVLKEMWLKLREETADE